MEGNQNKTMITLDLPSPCVPDRCKIVIDRRFLIEEKLPEVKSEVYKLLNNLKETRENFEF